MTYNAKIYGKLLAETVPGVIDSAVEYERLESVFNDLISKGEDNLSAEEFRLYELIGNLLEDYEKRTLPPLDVRSPLNALKSLMRENNLRQKDVVTCFGTQSVASEVLSGKREISKMHAANLASRFSVSTDLFI